jgi:outer membrane murein-binding lipoprotein Lpp
MQSPDQQPSSSPVSRPSSVPWLVAAIVVVFLTVAVITGLRARRSAQEATDMAATVAALQKDVESLRGDVRALRADSERSAVLNLADRGYYPLRTNGGTLLIAVAHAEPVEHGMRVDLRVGNPQSMTYRGFTLAFAWDKGKGTQVYPNVLAPDAWTIVSVSLAPADPKSTTSLTITSATVDEIVAR